MKVLNPQNMGEITPKNDGCGFSWVIVEPPNSIILLGFGSLEVISSICWARGALNKPSEFTVEQQFHIFLVNHGRFIVCRDSTITFQKFNKIQ